MASDYDRTRSAAGPADPNRRQLLRVGGLGAVAATTGLLSAGGAATEAAEHTPPGAGWPVSPLDDPSLPGVRFDVAAKPANPGGVANTGLLVNGALPGPELRLREGDRLHCVVNNRLSEPTGIHWHGLVLPATMDGVPGVSRAPIPPGEPFVYEWRAVQSGTYWYHSHYQLQEQLGLSGPLIIEPRREPLAYDREYVIFLTDWSDRDPYRVLPSLRGADGEDAPGGAADAHDWPDGSPFEVDVTYPTFPLNGKAGPDLWRGLVRPGERVRLRIINASAQSFFRVMVDDHPMTVTHTDGYPVQHVTTDSLVVATSERYDVLIEPKSSGAFAIRAAALGDVGGALGILHTPDAAPKVVRGVWPWGKRTLSYRQLRSVVPSGFDAGDTRAHDVPLLGDMRNYVWKMHEAPYPDAPPLEVRQGERVRVTLRNKTPMFHPMHLHGHTFRLLVRGTDDAYAPLKDSFFVAPGETLAFEFLADNPGRWFFHCHNLFHLKAGMARELHFVA